MAVVEGTQPWAVLWSLMTTWQISPTGQAALLSQSMTPAPIGAGTSNLIGGGPTGCVGWPFLCCGTILGGLPSLLWKEAGFRPLGTEVAVARSEANWELVL